MSDNCPRMFRCTKTVCSFHSAQSGTAVALRRTWALWTRWRGRCGAAVIPWRYIVHSKSRAVQTVVQPATDVSTLNEALKCLYVSLAPVLFQSSVLHCVTCRLVSNPTPPLPPAPPPPSPAPPENKTPQIPHGMKGPVTDFVFQTFKQSVLAYNVLKKKLHRQESGHKQWYNTEKNKVVGYKILFFFYTLKVTSGDGVERLHRIMFHLQRLWR